MPQRVIIIAGRKQSGKDSLGRFLLSNQRELFGPGTGKHFWFAGVLKDMVSDLFDVPRDWVYGTAEDKERLTRVRWNDLPHGASQENRAGFLTVRELLQQFGTEIVRRMDTDAWVRACLRSIQRSGVDLAVVTDCRFPNEVDLPRQIGAKVVRLRRGEERVPEHASEWALDADRFDWSQFDAVIDNRAMTLAETERAMVEHLRAWGWMPG